MASLADLNIKLFMDGADIPAMRRAVERMPFIKGFTTNPTLMRQAGVTSYGAFAREAIAVVGQRPISFEVFSDDFDEMERQARIIHGWGGAIYVKIPITDTLGRSAAPLIRTLSLDGIALNVTALTTLAQVEAARDALAPGAPGIISVFAGRIADTGVDPVPLMAAAKRLLAGRPRLELLWASPREVLNLFQADAVGCDILTATRDVIAKLPLVGRNLDDYSLDTVKMFHEDAKLAGFSL